MRLYLDHNAGTPVDPRVAERWLEVETGFPANPGSLHASGRAANAVLEQARAVIAAALGLGAETVVITSGGTEANNLAVRGLGDPKLPVLASAAEHPSVWEAAAASRGVVEMAVDAGGRTVAAAPGRRVGLVALVHAQNEVGTLQPIAAARTLATELGVPLHVDAAQTLGRVALGPALAAADTLALSLHKAGGPKGVGVLVVRDPVALRAGAVGGGQERGLRAGTPSAGLAAAAALAIELAVAETAERARAMLAARDAFLRGLAAECAPTGYRRLTPPDPQALPNTLMLRFDQVEDGRVLLPALDLAGIEASQGSACSSGSPTPPRILLAMGNDAVEVRRCVRFSFSHRTSIDEALRAGARVGDVVRRVASARR